MTIGRPPGGTNAPETGLPPLWLIDLLEGKLSARCLDDAADRRAVATAITEEMMARMMYKTPAHRGGRLRSRKRAP